jgi:hypothetical protein
MKRQRKIIPLVNEPFAIKVVGEKTPTTREMETGW